MCVVFHDVWLKILNKLILFYVKIPGSCRKSKKGFNAYKVKVVFENAIFNLFSVTIVAKTSIE